jgi:Cu/Zn superoxide dismutase
MVTPLLAAALAACGLPTDRGTPVAEVPTPDEQLLGPPDPAPEEVRDAAAYQEGAIIEGPLVAVVTGTRSHPEIAGRVVLTPDAEDTVQVDSRVVGLPPGEHGYQVHVRGDCSDPAGRSVGGLLAFDQLPRYHDNPQLDIGTATAPEGAPRRGPPGTSEVITSPGQVPVEETRKPTRGSTIPSEPEQPYPRPAPVVTDMPATALDGNLGELVAGEDGLATHSATVRGLYPDNIGYLVGRSVVIHAQGNDPTVQSGDAGEPIACGVLVEPAG